MNKKDKEFISGYIFNLQIKEKATGHEDINDIDGAKNLENIFLQEVVKILIDGIRSSEKTFNAKLASGELVQQEDGNFDMKGFSAPPKLQVEIDAENKMKKLNIQDNIKQGGEITRIKDKKDFTTGKEFDK